jgi:hypothetical protein
VNVLEGRTVLESQVILGWQREARQDQEVKTVRRDVLQVLQARFQMEPPEDLKRAVEGTNDLNMLSRWLNVAATAASLDDFRAAMASS